ncbi:M1 family metallopeptidase [Fulvivirgaceae bacterium LMO-SS25]
MKKLFILLLLVNISLISQAQQRTSNHANRFEQLGTELRTPNVYRTGSGAPGHMYWQQRADYEIDVELDDQNQKLYASELITYHNNSPDILSYLWLHLDENVRDRDADNYKAASTTIRNRMSFDALKSIETHDEDLGFKIEFVQDANGNALPYTINKTLMRIDLPTPLASGEKVQVRIKWWFNISDRLVHGGRPGYELFPDDGNYLYTTAGWFPRMAVYGDHEGWHNKQFTGRGEFALPFGDYKVNITVPADHVIGSTGQLQNPDDVLTSAQRERFEQAKNAENPVMIITREEAERNEKSKSTDTKTWTYHAENVRDFAWTSSRKFIWDAMGVDIDGKKVMAMSYYPKEAYSLYSRYSTQAVAHTLEVYSKFTIPYPYPVAISVEASNGMEYPMIAFNYGRTAPDGTYSAATKYGAIGVIIHEVGHNFFPMIINSDERQWTWMDEGLNSFVQFLAQQEWEPDYPQRRGPAHKIVDYMKSPKDLLEPIMTNSENIVQFGPNAYAKPATALNILRETIMGRELFDYAFKEYARRWAFKHPTPDDFFRTMEDASGVDLDWFWRGWFYSIDNVDIAIDNVEWYKLNSQNPEVDNPRRREEFAKEEEGIYNIRNRELGMEYLSDRKPTIIKDFYNSYDPFEVTEEQKEAYKRLTANLTAGEKAMLNGEWNFYEMQFSNIGGLVMPLILEFTFTDGTTEMRKIPAEIWRLNENQVSKVFKFNKEVASIRLDPFRETADVEEYNNHWPRNLQPSRFDAFKQQSTPRGAANDNNPMQRANRRR